MRLVQFSTIQLLDTQAVVGVVPCAAIAPARKTIDYTATSLVFNAARQERIYVMSFCSFARFNYLIIVSLLINLVPSSRQSVEYVTETAVYEMSPALTAEAVPAWFAVPGNETTTGLFLPTVGPVDYGLREIESLVVTGSPAQQQSIDSASRAPGGQGLTAVANTLPAASSADEPPPSALDTGRGYYPNGLTADFAATFLYSQPIDFNLSCTGEITSSYESCKLHPDLPRGDSYIGSWSGELLVPAEGVYTFWLSSTLDHRHPDDNARLYIDDALVADWWWDAPHRSPATATLSAGLHDILIVYAQRAKDQGCPASTLGRTWL
jgi:hypothetical protein